MCDASAIEQATVQVRSEVPLVREAFRGDRGFLDLTHQSIQRIGEWAVLKVLPGLPVARWLLLKPNPVAEHADGGFSHWCGDAAMIEPLSLEAAVHLRVRQGFFKHVVGSRPS